MQLSATRTLFARGNDGQRCNGGAIEYSIAQSAENNNAAKTLTSTDVSTTELPFGSVKYFFNAKARGGRIACDKMRF